MPYHLANPECGSGRASLLLLPRLRLSRRRTGYLPTGSNSTNEFLELSATLDSNQGPLLYQSSLLTTEIVAVVDRKGIKPFPPHCKCGMLSLSLTALLQSRESNPLSKAYGASVVYPFHSTTAPRTGFGPVFSSLTGTHVGPLHQQGWPRR